MDDIVLIKDALNGNYKARENLLQKYYDEIYVFIYKSIANQEISYELTHSVLMDLSKNLKKYKTGRNSFILWLYKTATNYILNYYDSEEHKIKVENFAKELNGDISDDLLEESMLRTDQETKILDVLVDLEKLSLHQRSIIILNYYTNLDVSAIALVLKSNQRKINKIKNETISILQAASAANNLNIKEIRI